MIISTTVTDEIRRDAVRELTKTTTASYPDDDLDAKIERWDPAALSSFGVVGVTLDGTESYFENLVTAANMLAAIAILVGIGGRDAIEQAREYRAMYKDLIRTQHGRSPDQHDNYHIKTSGIGKINPRGTFG